MEEEKRKGVFGRFLNGKGFYIVLILCIVAIGISGYILLFSNNKPAEDTTVSSDIWADDQVSVVIDVPPQVDGHEETETPEEVHMSAPVEDFNTAADQSEQVSAQTETVGADAVQTSISDAAAVSDEVSADAAIETAALSELFCAWPVVSGEVTQEWSVDALVYNITLGDWRVHDGVDISCSAGSAVMAIAPGVISEVYTDDLMGMTVVVDHKNGLTSIYSNLTNEISVAVGDAVNTGQQIGAVGDTAVAEQNQGSHLHLAMAWDGDSINPLDYISAY